MSRSPAAQWWLVAAILAAPALRAQGAAAPQKQDEVLTVERVREVVSFLAADELRGRQSPSPGLETAAQYVQDRWQQAGFAPGAAGAWRQRYTTPGQRLDSRSLELEVVLTEGEREEKVTLRGDADVRLLRAGATADGNAPRATVLRSGDSRLGRALGYGGGRTATLVEVSEQHPLWLDCAGEREAISRRLRGSAPVFLVREGALAATAAVPTDVKASAPTAWSVSWRGADAAAVDVELTNVVGVLRGAELPDEYVLVSAHYDHVGIGAPVDGDAIYNGADDDATGTTALVLLSELLARGPRPRRSVMLVAFSAEEKGLRGSAAFVAEPPVPLAAIVANVNIEMIGRPEEGSERAAWITGAEYSDFAAIAGPALQSKGIELVDFPQARQLFAQSDNWSLARMGVVAHSISAGSLHGDYHQPSDEVEKLDLPHMTAVIAGIEAVVRQLADRDGRPEYSEAGRAALERGRGR
ncbi:MAG: M28 family peptidase [Planctomycetota bacterium]